jgi:hypothetical protein
METCPKCGLPQLCFRVLKCKGTKKKPCDCSGIFDEDGNFTYEHEERYHLSIMNLVTAYKLGII